MHAAPSMALSTICFLKVYQGINGYVNLLIKYIYIAFHFILFHSKDCSLESNDKIFYFQFHLL